MITIVIAVSIMLSILLGAFVSFSPSFKSLVETDFKRKAQENAWSYTLKRGQLIERANSLASPPDNLSCGANTTGGGWECKETLALREIQTTSGSNWTDAEHICVEVRSDGEKIIIDKITPTSETCPQ